MMKKLGTLLLFSLACGGASAGPIFSLVGSGGIAPLHPEGDENQDRMVVSGHFSIAATGGDLQIEISLATALSVPIYGNVSGNWTINGSSVLLGTAGLGLAPSQAEGGWELTGYSTVPEHTGEVLLPGSLELMLRRRNSMGIQT